MPAPHFYRAEGIILKRKNVGEGDSIITVFTKEHGKMRLMAKGIRRVTSRRAPYLDLFHHVRLLVRRGKIMDMITEVEMVEPFAFIRSDLTRVGIAYYFCELIDVLLPEHQEHADVFVLLTRSFGDISSYSPQQLPVFAGRVSFSLLTVLGFLVKGKEPVATELIAYIERIAEKRLKTPKFYRLLTRTAAI